VSGAGAVGELTVWLTKSFAPDWFVDAVTEAKKGNNQGARRREILFAVAAAESYLLEWVRDDILHKDFPRLEEYFKPGNFASIAKKWRDIPKQLKIDGLIVDAPNLGGQSWQEFLRLIDFRNGLLHARASRPETAGLREEQMPLPTLDDLARLQAGWAVKVVSAIILELNGAAKTVPPDWLSLVDRDPGATRAE